jgi:RNA 2',3'-cyclic 3'-phosphodiesterase
VTESRRLFFAVWPDEAAARALHETAREAQRVCGGRLMRRETLHLTLAFLGGIPAARFVDAASVAADIAFDAFTLTLDQLAYWKHNRIVWCGGESEPLAALATTLSDGLRGAGFRLESRPFVAHMTLLRDARCAAPPPLAAPIAWPVSEFTLVESSLSDKGPQYEVVGRWGSRRPLSGG